MIKRDGWGHLYCTARGEILGLVQDGLEWKHLPRMFLLINNESRRFKDDDGWPRWDLNPQSSTTDADALSIRPHQGQSFFVHWACNSQERSANNSNMLVSPCLTLSDYTPKKIHIVVSLMCQCFVNPWATCCALWLQVQKPGTEHSALYCCMVGV